MLLLSYAVIEFLWMRMKQTLLMMQLPALLLGSNLREGTVYTHDVNLKYYLYTNWGVVTKTFRVTVTRKVQ